MRFIEDPHHKDVYKYNGQHPLVRGNSVIRLNDKWTATSVFSSYARRTGEKYTPTDLAGIIIHEQFHIFQRISHTQWRQNDAILLFYPEETRESLYLRRVEKEAFRRAVTAEKTREIAGWAKVATGYRAERFGQIFDQFADYEKELQRTEGLSDYIERVARGLDPLNASNITNGIAPAGIRDMGYVEGRWIAMILDRLDPDWKLILENNDTLYLEEILVATLDKMEVKNQSFTADELNEIRKSAGNDSGSLRIMNHPCITWFDNSFRLSGVVINGLKEAPEVVENDKRIMMKYDNISIDFKYRSVSDNHGKFIVTL